MFGLSIEKLILIGVVAAFIIGPERLPGLARTVGEWMRKAREIGQEAKSQFAEELGPEVVEVGKELNPRKLSGAARTGARSTTEALSRAVMGDEPAAAKAGSSKNSSSTTGASSRGKARLEQGSAAPFDSEAT